MVVGQEEYVFEFSGGELCLDFANTVSDRAEAAPAEHLHGYPDLVAWGRQAGLIDGSQADTLLAEAGRQPAAAAQVHARALTLREAIYRMFARRATGLPPAPEDIAIVNDELGRALAHARVVPAGQGFAWGWAQDCPALDRVLWPVARSAAELLTSEELDRVRECAADTCNWLFLDTSKNRSRRWCDMKSCGNRAKAKRHYARLKSGAGDTGHSR